MTAITFPILLSSIRSFHVFLLFSGMDRFRALLQSRNNWWSWLASLEDRDKVNLIKNNTLRDIPIGSEEFLDYIEQEHNFVAHAPKLGGPKKGKLQLSRFSDSLLLV